MATLCKGCGAKKGIADAFTAPIGADFYCDNCRWKMQQTKEAQAAARVRQLRAEAAKVLVTTTPSIEGHRIVEYLGIESVEYVLGTGVFSEVITDWADFFGQRSRAFESKLHAAKVQTFEALKYIAAEKGANAIVGIDMDFAEFSNNRVALILNGTLVRIEPLESHRVVESEPAAGAAPPEPEPVSAPAPEPEKIKFECPTCQHEMKASASQAGKKGHCPRCKATVRVPELETT